MFSVVHSKPNKWLKFCWIQTSRSWERGCWKISKFCNRAFLKNRQKSKCLFATYFISNPCRYYFSLLAESIWWNSVSKFLSYLPLNLTHLSFFAFCLSSRGHCSKSKSKIKIRSRLTDKAMLLVLFSAICKLLTSLTTEEKIFKHWWGPQNWKITKSNMAAKPRDLRSCGDFLFCSQWHCVSFKKNCRSLSSFWKFFPC